MNDLTRLKTLFVFSAIISSILAVIGLFNRYFWICDLACHFRTQYCVTLGACALYFALIRSWKPFWFCLLTAFILIIPQIPANTSASASTETGDGSRIRIVMMNLRQDNTNYTAALDYLNTVKPDIIALAELDQRWFEALTPVLSEYSYSLYEIRNDNFGIGLFSSAQPDNGKMEYYGQAGFPTVVTSFILSGQPVSLVFTHPVSPVTQLKWQLRNDQLEQIIPHRQHWHDTLIFLGDLNTTEWSSIYKRLIRELDVFDSRQGFGLQPSWHQVSPILSIPIDHAFLSHNITVTNREIGPDIGSDHKPVLLELLIPDKKENAAK
ncbi:MAG: endonuclease/exonuclease/phosphatase family protein [Candidatus Auribacterota bacterium]